MSLVIRLARDEDAASLTSIYAPSVAERATSFELVPPDAVEMKRRIVTVLKGYPWLVCESSQGVVGYSYATGHRERAAYRWSVDVGVYVRDDVQRQGIARTLYTRLFEVLALQGYRNAYAGVTLPNPPSLNLHKAMGFKEVGVYHQVGFKFGQWHDVAWLEKPLADHVLDPPEPVPLSTLFLSEKTKAAIEILLAPV
jgi:L-amino acid N-acyltransferase YncA